jgi:hypothetical protein
VTNRLKRSSRHVRVYFHFVPFIPLQIDAYTRPTAPIILTILSAAQFSYLETPDPETSLYLQSFETPKTRKQMWSEIDLQEVAPRVSCHRNDQMAVHG